MRRTSPPSMAPGAVMWASLRKGARAFASDSASGWRDFVPSGRMTASSSRTMAGSSTNMESGRVGLGGERVDVDAEFCEEMFVGGVLGLGFGEVDGLAFDEGEFAVGEGGAYGAGDGGEHREILAESFGSGGRTWIGGSTVSGAGVPTRTLPTLQDGRYGYTRRAFLARANEFWRAWWRNGSGWRDCVCAASAGFVFAGDGSSGQNAAAKSNGNEQKLEAAVDEVFQDLTAAGSPGCALGVYRGGQIIYEKGYGLANIEENVPISPKSVFDIGSTSKQFTATSILLLEKAGKLSVDDDVHKYIPELPDYGKKITILNLLNHTSGLRDYLALFRYRGRERRQRDDG